MIELYNEDCMIGLQRYPDKHFDLAIVDPPYGIIPKNPPSRIRKYGRVSIANDVPPCLDFFDKLLTISKNAVVWGGNYFTLPVSRGWIFWHKHQPVDTYADGELAWTSFDRNLQCFSYPYFGNINSDLFRIHPTQKPVALYRWLLNNYAHDGDKILDTHLGSGSIAIACHDMGFDLTGFEIDKEYFEAAKKRLEDHQRQARFNFANEIAPKPSGGRRR